MIAKPTTRDQARQNAILAAESAQQRIASSGRSTPWSELAKAWAAIAETFPHTETQLEDDAPETHTEKTLGKVHRGLRTLGMNRSEALDVVNAIQNEGILFRERDALPLDPQVDRRVYVPGDTVHTENAEGDRLLEFTVLTNGDLVLEDGTHPPQQRPMYLSDEERETIQALRAGTALVVPASGSAVTSETFSVAAQKRHETVAYVRRGDAITDTALKALRAFAAARVVHSDDEGISMTRSDHDRYAREALKITVGPNRVHIEIDAERED